MRRKRGDGTVCKRKDGRYEAAAYVNTTKGIKRVRRYADTRSKAEAILVELRNKNDSGLLASSKEKKLGDYLDYWLLLIKPTLRPGTYLSYEVIVRKYLKPGIGNKCLTKLCVRDVRLHLENQSRLGATNRTLQKQRMVLALALKYAESEDILSRNVAKLVKPPQYHPKEIVPWNSSQLKRFIDFVSGDQFYPIFVLLGAYGLRTSEALGLSWNDIDFDNKVIHIRQQLQYYDGAFHYADLKTRAGRRELPLLSITQNALRSVSRSEIGPMPDLIFKTINGNPIDRRNLLRRFQRLSKNAELPVIALHHIRHTTATILKDMGVDAKDTQLILGHAHISTTQQIYQHSGLEQRSLILEKYEQKLVQNSGSSRQIKPSSKIKTIEFLDNNSGEFRPIQSFYPRLMSPAL